MPLESLYSNQVSAMASDTLSPAKVLGLAYTVEQGKVILTWDANTEDDLMGYRIYRKDSAESSFVLLDSVPAGIETYQDTTMLDGATYIYAVSAYDDEEPANEGEKSDELIVKTIPSVPQNLGADAGDAIIVLSWDSVLDDGNPKKNENLAGYNVYRSEQDGTGYVSIGQTAANVTRFEDNSVVNGKEYFYVVTAFDNSP